MFIGKKKRAIEITAQFCLLNILKTHKTKQGQACMVEHKKMQTTKVRLLNYIKILTLNVFIIIQIIFLF